MLKNPRAGLVIDLPLIGDPKPTFSRGSQDRSTHQPRLRHNDARQDEFAAWDPEVYRLGYGDPAALDLLIETAQTVSGALRRQPGIRIGIIIADARTLVFSPTPRLIEAGPNSPGAANTVYLGVPPPALVRRHTAWLRPQPMAGFESEGKA